MDDALDAAEKPVEGERIRTSWPDLNQLYAGHFPKHLVILGARPAVGKTLIALGMARHAAIEAGIATLYISLEISDREVIYRLLACEAGIELSHLIESRCTDADWDKLARARRVIDPAPFYVHDADSITVAGVDRAIASVERRHGVKIGLVVIDYLQLMDAAENKRTANRQEEVASLSRGLKKLAKKRDISIIACAQLNRGPTQRADKKPTMSDLRESGAIEADADNILLLHREADPESPRVGEIDVIVEKQRNGPKGTVTLAFQGHRGRAMSMSADRYGAAR
jgi:replicative DNA helicase